MPAILMKKDIEEWLDISREIENKFSHILKPYPSAEMHTYRVSKIVNSPLIDVPECTKPVSYS
jgi:putative SOS response-associated peptidase YedK